MNWVREFGMREGLGSVARNIEGAPDPMRHELIDLYFGLVEQNPELIPEDRLYRIIAQSLGAGASGNPYGGFRYEAGRDLSRVEWPRVYDLISRLWPEFERVGFAALFREGVNRILAAYGIAWDLGEDGSLHRVLPLAAQEQVKAAFAELRDRQYAAAIALFNAARDAYDARPRRSRDACANIFDALESVAKTKYGVPQSTYGQVVARITEQHQQGRANDFRTDTIALLRGLNDLRNHHFGHGVPFQLTDAEVDFVFLTCIGAILLLTRTP
jgi:hypothetical protein